MPGASKYSRNMQNEEMIVDWNCKDPWCRVCGNRQFTILDTVVAKIPGELWVCDTCRMVYLKTQDMQQGHIRVLGFLPQVNYFNMLVNGRLDFAVSMRKSVSPEEN